jgi:hypothetical protein
MHAQDFMSCAEFIRARVLLIIQHQHKGMNKMNESGYYEFPYHYF